MRGVKAAELLQNLLIDRISHLRAAAFYNERQTKNGKQRTLGLRLRAHAVARGHRLVGGTQLHRLGAGGAGAAAERDQGAAASGRRGAGARGGVRADHAGCTRQPAHGNGWRTQRASARRVWGNGGWASLPGSSSSWLSFLVPWAGSRPLLKHVPRGASAATEEAAARKPRCTARTNNRFRAADSD